MDMVIYIFLFLVTLFLYFLAAKKSSKRLPPGSNGFPIVGQGLSLLRALKNDTAGLWLMERSRKYGPVSKLNIFGSPTVFIPGQAATKFIFKSNCLSAENLSSARRILGDKNIAQLSGLEHKRIRGALLSFLKPDVLKQCVGIMDKEIKSQIKSHWHGKQKIQTMQFMKTLSFNMMGSFIVGIEQGSRRDRLCHHFHHLLDGLLALPLDLPFTSFNRSMKSRSKIRIIVMELVKEKRAVLQQQKASPQQDLLSCLISLSSDEGLPILSDEEIVDNIVLAMVAGHDTTSVLLTFLIRLLANDSSICARVLQEQEEIAKSKAPGEPLEWDDLKRMSYSWSVALETLRMHPPAFFTFRKVIKDFEYGGYLIPKGWQVCWIVNLIQYQVQTQNPINPSPNSQCRFFL